MKYATGMYIYMLTTFGATDSLEIYSEREVKNNS